MAVLLKNAGGREGLEKKVKQANAVASLLEKHGMEGLKKSVRQAEALGSVLESYGVEGLKKIVVKGGGLPKRQNRSLKRRFWSGGKC